MTGDEIAQVLTGVAALVSAVASSAAVVIGALNGRGIKHVHELTQDVRAQTNSKMTQLVDEVRASATAAGVKEGREAAERSQQ